MQFGFRVRAKSFSRASISPRRRFISSTHRTSRANRSGGLRCHLAVSSPVESLAATGCAAAGASFLSADTSAWDFSDFVPSAPANMRSAPESPITSQIVRRVLRRVGSQDANSFPKRARMMDKSSCAACSFLEIFFL